MTAPPRYLNSVDGLFLVKRSLLESLTGGIEMLVGILAFRGAAKCQQVGLISVACLASCFLAYRIVTSAFGISEPCHCIFGGAPIFLALRFVENQLAVAVLFVLLVGSYGLIYLRCQPQTSQFAVKMN